MSDRPKGVRVLIHIGEEELGIVELSRVPCVGEFITGISGVVLVQRVLHSASRKLYDAGVACEKTVPAQ